MMLLIPFQRTPIATARSALPFPDLLHMHGLGLHLLLVAQTGCESGEQHRMLVLAVEVRSIGCKRVVDMQQMAVDSCYMMAVERLLVWERSLRSPHNYRVPHCCWLR